MKTENQKLKIIYLMEILSKYTDEEHLLNANEIIEKLKVYGINAERKSIYSDISLLSESGLLDIEQISGRNGGFHVLSRRFELAELKMLVDAVQASKFISNKQCSSLIKKLGDFASVFDEKKLSRSVYIYDRVQDKEKNAYYLIDTLHFAISENKSITFQYTEMSPSKKRIKRRNGELYEVSPYALLWRDEFYYLVAFDHTTEAIRHYRVDKMENITACDNKRRGEKEFEKLKISDYNSNIFEMFGGKEYMVHFRCDNSLAGSMIDRFGTSITISEYDGYFEFYAPVQISVRFFGWVFGFEGKLKILSPDVVVSEYKKQISLALESV